MLLTSWTVWRLLLDQKNLVICVSGLCRRHLKLGCCLDYFHYPLALVSLEWVMQTKQRVKIKNTINSWSLSKVEAPPAFDYCLKCYFYGENNLNISVIWNYINQIRDIDLFLCVFLLMRNITAIYLNMKIINKIMIREIWLS